MIITNAFTIPSCVLRSPEGDEGIGIASPESSDSNEPTPDTTSSDDQNPEGEASEQTANDENTENPFEFDDSSDDEDSNDTSQQETPEGDYTLTLGSSFDGTDEDLQMISSKAKECGIPAEAASSFVNQVLDELNNNRIENDRAQLNNLREAWGNKFDANMRETKRFIKNIVAKEKFPEDTLQFLKTPHAFRLANAIRSMISESDTKGFAGSAAARSRQQQIEDFNNNPSNAYHKILSNPDRSHTTEYKEAAEHINKLLGYRMF